MKDLTYFCTSCGFKTQNTQEMIKGAGGCTSCGKSGYKCPRCGLYMKTRKNSGLNVHQNKNSEPHVKLVVFKPEASVKSGRNIRINRP